MAKVTDAKGKGRRKNLPKSPNGHKRKPTHFTCWGYNKETLKREAKEKGVSVNYLLNMKMFKDWF